MSQSFSRIGDGVHRLNAEPFSGYVFRTHSPIVSLWAWACYWPRGSSSGVTHSFKGARLQVYKDLKLYQEWEARDGR